MSEFTDTEAIKPPNPRKISLDDLWHLADQGLLPRLSWQKNIASIRDDQKWRLWGFRILLVLGVAHLLAGIVFFFAYNWAELPKFTKFGLLFAGIVSSFGLWWFKGPDSRLGELFGVSSTVLTGILMAVFGQIYQTGADAHELFIAWAALTLPWMLIAKSPIHIFVWVVIADTAYGLYASQVMEPIWDISAALLLMLNAVMLLIVLGALKRAARVLGKLSAWWLEGSLIIGLTLHLGFAGWVAAEGAHSSKGFTETLPEFLLILTAQILFLAFFLKITRNLLGSILSLAALISSVCIFIVFILLEPGEIGAGMLLLLALIVSVASALFLYLSKRATKQLQNAGVVA
jgi:uncharacterized membrane protein